MVGRTDLLEAFEVMLARVKRGRTEQSLLITGLRGVGKTVLLGAFRRKAFNSDGVVLELEVSRHTSAEFRLEVATRMRTALLEVSPRTRWSERLKHAAAVLKSFSLNVDPAGAVTAGFGVDAVTGYADHSHLALDLADLFVAVGEAAADHGRVIVLLIDEIQFLLRDQFEAVIEALHKCTQRNLPVIMVGAGLPHAGALATSAKSYAERLFQFATIGNLSPEDTKKAFALPAVDEGAIWDNDALALAARATEGYPYFIQELGYAVWPLAEGPNITFQDVVDAIPGYQAKLDQSFFRVRLERATPLQTQYLLAMAKLGSGPQRAQDVAAAMGRPSNQLGPVRAALIGLGLLYTPSHGYAAFTVPQFDKYMLRMSIE
jgi:GTPase SAR1 family protein